MEYKKQKHIKLICLLLAVLIGAAMVVRDIQNSRQEEYYRSFYRANTESDQVFYRAVQQVYDVVTQNDYNIETLRVFFASDVYYDALQKMEEQIGVQEKLYAEYPVVDFSPLNRLERNLDNLKKFTDLVLSDRADYQMLKSSFGFLGLNIDLTDALEEMEKWLADPKFPSKSDHYVNPALGRTPLVDPLFP